jgi:hypothetical protein
MQRSFFALTFGAMLLSQACRTIPKIPESNTGQFPAFEAINLNDEVLQFPQVLEGGCNALVVSFENSQQATAEKWQQRLRGNPRVRIFWSMPLLGEQPIFEEMIRNSMKNDSEELTAKETTVPIFYSSGPLLRALKIADEKNVWVGVVSPGGFLVGAVTGAYSLESATEIERLLEVCDASAAAAGSR